MNVGPIFLYIVLPFKWSKREDMNMFHDQPAFLIEHFLLSTTFDGSSSDTFVHSFSPLIIAMVLLAFVDLCVIFYVSWTFFCSNYYLI
jgi:hypothetical protein